MVGNYRQENVSKTQSGAARDHIVQNRTVESRPPVWTHFHLCRKHTKKDGNLGLHPTSLKSDGFSKKACTTRRPMSNITTMTNPTTMTTRRSTNFLLLCLLSRLVTAASVPWISWFSGSPSSSLRGNDRRRLENYYKGADYYTSNNDDGNDDNGNDDNSNTFKYYLWQRDDDDG